MGSTVATLLFLIFLVAFYNPIIALESQKISEKIKVRVCLKFTVHVMNGMKSNEKPLSIHCQSRDDDLGSHVLYKGGDFHFKFVVNFVGPRTWFTCDMQWGSKHQHVDVFRQKIEGSICCVDGGNVCYWKAQEDGIYFGVDNEMWIKRYDWLG